MGTRSITNLQVNGNPVATIYRQYDGYPSGLGQELIDFAKSKTLVNGFGVETDGIANGSGCYFAQLIAELKDGVGNVYLYPIDSNDCGEEFTYCVNIIENRSVNGIYVSCRDWNENIVFQWKKTEQSPEGIFMTGNAND